MKILIITKNTNEASLSVFVTQLINSCNETSLIEGFRFGIVAASCGL